MITFFIVGTGVAVALETMPDLPAKAQRALVAFELVAAAIFAVEYGLRLAVARDRVRYAVSFWGLVDLVAFLPTFLALGSEALALRTLRLVRLLRLLKLIKRDTAFDRITHAIVSIREELLLVLLAAAVMIYLAAVGIYLFEHRVQPDAYGSVPESLWWALVTLTTVGYGDVVPITTGGRIFAGVVIIVGIGIVALPTALVTAALMQERNNRNGDKNGEGER